MTIYTVTDLGYGDAGKGTTVDFLCHGGGPSSSNLVVRHNGGSQAGHNVVLPEGTHHEFSQFGAGTLQCASTFLSRFMLVNPLDMELEAVHLDQVLQEPYNVWGFMSVDVQAKVVTPYHTAVNRMRENARGVGRHGSCGKGIGVTVSQDQERPTITLRVEHLTDGFSLKNRLEALRSWAQRKIDGVIPVDREDPNYAVLWDSKLSADLVDQYVDWTHKVNLVADSAEFLAHRINLCDNVIFEGSQGVLLDEWRGFHPHTTWSTTTDQNALILLSEAQNGEVSVLQDRPVRLGVTRAYMTRHGAGPFVTEDDSLEYAEPHNNWGAWQGFFRQGHLDLVALQYAMDANGGVDGLVVTHLDRSEDWKLAREYDLQHFNVNKLLLNQDKTDLKQQEKLTDLVYSASPVYQSVDTQNLLATLEEFAPVYLQSWGPTSDDKIIMKGIS